MRSEAVVSERRACGLVKSRLCYPILNPLELCTEPPVFYGQITDSSKLSRVVRNQGQAEAPRMGRDEQIVCTDHRAKHL